MGVRFVCMRPYQKHVFVCACELCACVSLLICMYICMCVCMYIQSMFWCARVYHDRFSGQGKWYVHVCMYVCMYVYTRIESSDQEREMCVHMHVCNLHTACFVIDGLAKGNGKYTYSEC
jgi:hypothetical protein